VQLSEKAVVRASEVFHRARLGDKRLECRAVALAEALAQAPNVGLPNVWSTPAALEAGYRFLRNPRTEFAALMMSCQQATHESALKERSVLVIHDTTDISCPAAEPEEVGFLQTGKPGFYVHHALCVREDTARTPLGIVWSEAWARPQRTLGRKPNTAGSTLAREQARESDRWLEGLTEAQLWTDGCEQVTHVFDSEADSYRVLDHARELGADFVVRMRHDRRLDEGHLADELARSTVKLRRRVAVSRRKKGAPSSTYEGRKAREVSLAVRTATVEIQPPSYMVAEPITVNVVQVLEENPARGNEPVAWVLATSLPLDTRAKIERVIDIYRARWVIEEFHKALKTGCMFEKRQLESFESITTLLALCYPIACELLRVRSRARQPEIPAVEVFRETQLACLRAHPKARPLPDNPSAAEVLAVIAGLGGHIKHNGPAGWQTLAAGYMQLTAFEQGWIAALTAQKI
jgi:hypothetical protein